MAITTLFIDLDDTLYPASSGVWSLIRQRIDQYMVEKLDYPADQVADIRKDLFQTYGTTMRGLQATGDLDEKDFLSFVHDVPVEHLLKADPALRRLLLAYPQRKVIFTNADTRHANRVMNALGMVGVFDLIVDIIAISPYCKPQPGAFATALKLSGESDPSQVLVIDDAPRNLQAARSLGFNTILVQEVDPNPPAGSLISQAETQARFLEKSFSPSGESTMSFPQITSLHDLPRAFLLDEVLGG